jgi:hypothetical protein
MRKNENFLEMIEIGPMLKISGAALATQHLTLKRV